MGTSSAQIDTEIATTREQIDANLDTLEKRAATSAKRAAMVAGAGAAVALVAGVAYVVWQRTHPPTLRERVQHAVPDSWGDLQKQLAKRLGNRPFKVVISTLGDDEGESLWEATLRKAAPAVITSALTGLVAQAARRRNTGSGREPTHA
jgi:hypothetical protein